MKWVAPSLAYLAVGVGLFLFHSAWGALLGFHTAIVLSLLVARPKLPVSVLFRNTQFKWIAWSVLLCGGSGVMLYLLWDRFGLASDLAA